MTSLEKVIKLSTKKGPLTDEEQIQLRAATIMASSSSCVEDDPPWMWVVFFGSMIVMGGLAWLLVWVIGLLE